MIRRIAAWSGLLAGVVLLSWGGHHLTAQEGDAPASPEARMAVLKKRAAEAPRPDTWFELGRLQFEAGDAREGFRSVARAVSIAPAGHYSRTYLAHELDKTRFKSDVSLLEELRKILPEDPMLLERLGRLYQGVGKDKEAEALFRKWVALRPDAGEPLARLAEFQRASGHAAEAVPHWEKMRGLNGESAYALRRLGVVYRELGDLDASARVLDRAITLRRDNADTLRGMGTLGGSVQALQQAVAQVESEHDQVALMELGHTRMAQHRPKDAVPAFRKVVELDPGSPAFRVFLAKALAEAGQEKEALTEYRKAVELDKFSLEAQLGLGRLLLSRGDFAGALPHLREASSRNDRDPDLHFLVGETALKAGDLQVAEFEHNKLKQIRSTTLAQKLGELIEAHKGSGG